jgi:hypothetical protein
MLNSDRLRGPTHLQPSCFFGIWTASSLTISIGPSGVRALPLAAGINVGRHYKWHFFLSLSLFSPDSLLILPEGIVVGF